MVKTKFRTEWTVLVHDENNKLVHTRYIYLMSPEEEGRRAYECAEELRQESAPGHTVSVVKNLIPPEDRVKCLVGDCRRTTKKDGFNEWICHKHWTAIPKKYRRLYSLAKRKYKKGEISHERIDRVWKKCKNQALMNAWTIK